MLKKLFGLFKKSEISATKVKLMPEASVIVSFDDDWIKSSKPDGLVEKVKWCDLKAVIIETTDDGPFAPDVFWILVGENETGCVFPGGATGEEEILEEMQKCLKGFDNETFIQAMGSCNNNKFLIWKSKD
ncbi:MAG: hypothetical protein GY702_00995 [Desulfobulbaceae bacterium]|nr:hypothetical protein [Desulfobulbaceae bacterium]